MNFFATQLQFPFATFVFVFVVVVLKFFAAGQKYLASNIPNSSRNKSTIRKICYRVKASWKLEFPFGKRRIQKT